ncbi:Nucleoside-diphosphate sugar epimerase [Balamuthia mandrillaris]
MSHNKLSSLEGRWKADHQKSRTCHAREVCPHELRSARRQGSMFSLYSMLFWKGDPWCHHSRTASPGLALRKALSAQPHKDLFAVQQVRRHAPGSASGGWLAAAGACPGEKGSRSHKAEPLEEGQGGWWCGQMRPPSRCLKKSLVAQLLRSPTFSTVTTLGRRSVPLETYLRHSTEEDSAAASQKLRQQVLEDLAQLPEHKELFQGHDTVFCCLGTTIKRAGSQQQFRKVDHDYVLAAAHVGKEQGVQQFSLVSSIGASPSSWTSLYRVKGEVEEDLKAVGFPTLSIFRPSLLMTEREDRPGLWFLGRLWVR